MFNFLKFKSSTTTVNVPTAPCLPIEFETVQEGVESHPKVTRGKVLLWTYFRALSEVCRTLAGNQTMTINELYDHFLSYFGVARHEVTRRQFGLELHRWIREHHLPLRATKPRASAAHVEGIDLVTLCFAFQE